MTTTRAFLFIFVLFASFNPFLSFASRGLYFSVSKMTSSQKNAISDYKQGTVVDVQMSKLSQSNTVDAAAINGKSFEDSFLTLKNERELIKNPLILVNLNNNYDIDIKVKGGGMNSQLDAVKLAIAKGICSINTEYRSILNQQLLLRRDSRIKERRKYGLKKARKASQYSKR